MLQTRRVAEFTAATKARVGVLGRCGDQARRLSKRQKGVSFRHAIELLRADPSLAAGAAASVAQHATVRRLPVPVTLDADEQTLLDETLDYYHQTLKASPEALAYLEARGLAHPELVDRFKLGYANRTLGLRLPLKNRVASAELRSKLQRIGIQRESGHEHFNGSLVVPILDADGHAVEVYGRKVRDDLRPGTPRIADKKRPDLWCPIKSACEPSCRTTARKAEDAHRQELVEAALRSQIPLAE